MFIKVSYLALILLSVSVLFILSDCEGNNGEDGIATIDVIANSEVITGEKKVWMGIVTGLKNIDKKYPEGVIVGVGNVFATQSDLPDFYVLTQGTEYIHDPGIYECVFIWEYYDHSDSNSHSGYYTIEINKGEDGTSSMGIFPQSGKDGIDNHYHIRFGLYSENISLNKPSDLNKDINILLKDRLEIIRQIISKNKCYD